MTMKGPQTILPVDFAPTHFLKEIHDRTQAQDIGPLVEMYDRFPNAEFGDEIRKGIKAISSFNNLEAAVVKQRSPSWPERDTLIEFVKVFDHVVFTLVRQLMCDHEAVIEQVRSEHRISYFGLHDVLAAPIFSALFTRIGGETSRNRANE